MANTSWMNTIVPARDNDASARFFAHIFGLDSQARILTSPRCG